MKDLTDILDKYNQKYTIVDDKVIGDIIDLVDKGLTTLPYSICKLKCNALYLGRNDLISLPESIGGLVCHQLYLHENKITTLPESIVDLICREIILCSNNLTTLPKLNENITHLSLTNNNLTYLPKLNKNITVLYIDNFDDLTNLLYLPNLISLCIGNIGFYYNESLTELLNKIKHQKVMNDMNKILQTL